MDERDNPLRALREGRISVETAARWVEMEQQADRRDVRAAARQVRAHSTQQALQQAHNALDFGFGAHPDPASEFARLYPPGQYGPDDDEDQSEDHNYAPQRSPNVQQGGTRASAAYMSDAERFRLLFGRAPKPGELDDD